jgi:hypothetical protein
VVELRFGPDLDDREWSDARSDCTLPDASLYSSLSRKKLVKATRLPRRRSGAMAPEKIETMMAACPTQTKSIPML